MRLIRGSFFYDFESILIGKENEHCTKATKKSFKLSCLIIYFKKEIGIILSVNLNV